MIHKLIVMSLCAIIMGCVTTGQKAISVIVEENGRIKVEGRDATLTEIGQAVKKTGAKPGAVIEVHLPKDASLNLRQALIRNLARAGYSRTFFIKERLSSSYIEEKVPTPQKNVRSGTF